MSIFSEAVRSPLYKQLANFALSHTAARHVKLSGHLSLLNKELSHLQSLTSFSTAKQFWRAWDKMHKLKTAVQELTLTSRRQEGLSPKQRLLLTLSLFGIGGSMLLDAVLFALFGYLTYASRLRLPKDKLWLFLALGALGGFVLGGALGLLTQWYRRRREPTPQPLPRRYR